MTKTDGYSALLLTPAPVADERHPVSPRRRGLVSDRLRGAEPVPGRGLAGHRTRRTYAVSGADRLGTLAAFLAVIDGLLREGLERGLPDRTRVPYVSPLKALSTDIRLNLQRPLSGIAGQLAARGLPPVALRAWVRTGDTPSRQQARRPPGLVPGAAGGPRRGAAAR